MNHLEMKSRFETDEAGTITGIAWPFATPDRVGDMVQKGAFAGVPAIVPMLFGHDPLQPVGTWDHFEETDEGLHVRGRLLIGDVARAREVHALVKKGAVTGLSIGFHTKDSFRRLDRGRTITALDLAELSLVTFPSHPGARITNAKSAAHAIAEPFRIAEAINRARLALRTAA